MKIEEILGDWQEKDARFQRLVVQRLRSSTGIPITKAFLMEASQMLLDLGKIVNEV